MSVIIFKKHQMIFSGKQLFVTNLTNGERVYDTNLVAKNGMWKKDQTKSQQVHTAELLRCAYMWPGWRIMNVNLDYNFISDIKIVFWVHLRIFSVIYWLAWLMTSGSCANWSKSCGKVSDTSTKVMLTWPWVSCQGKSMELLGLGLKFPQHR